LSRISGKFTGNTKPNLIFGDPDKNCSDKWSSKVVYSVFCVLSKLMERETSYILRTKLNIVRNIYMGEYNECGLCKYVKVHLHSRTTRMNTGDQRIISTHS